MMRILTLVLLAALCGCGPGPTAPGDTGSVTSLSVASVDVRAGTARIVWQAREGAAGTFLVQRRLEGAPWKGLASATLDDRARLTLEDASVQPGARYAYRVRVAVEPQPLYAGEVALEVPPQ